MPNTAFGFARFMARPLGRGIRVIAGLALIALGWSKSGTTPGMVLMIVGIVPLLAGVLNVCLVAPIIGAPFSGRAALEGGRGR